MPQKSQRLAAYPYHSSWVAASAGSGKTKVLTDRVINLLLEGCLPERILCLTFTKAAAAEMAGRVRERLGEWAILPRENLIQSLETLQGTPPSPDKVDLASRLFGMILDTPGGLKIQTIHSFCGSLLKRFPLEAGLSPFFEVMDETDRVTLLKSASQLVMEDPNLAEILKTLILRFSETSFKEFNAFFIQERSSFPHLEYDQIDKSFQTKNLTESQLIQELLHHIPNQELKESLPHLAEGSQTDQEKGFALGQFLSFTTAEKEERFEEYLESFLTQKGEKRARLVTQKIDPLIKDLFEREALRLEGWVQKKNALEIAHVSKALFIYGQSYLKIYEDLKKARSLLDYEDLILKTVELLKNPGCHWVLYKLDGGLDHILLDEAQDTSPSQWQVIRAIAEEFYANAAADPRNRTLFIVGDEKQSIYSFQGADPLVFTKMQQDLRTFAEDSGKDWKDIDLNISFRSTPEILEVVDAVFENDPLSSSTAGHLPFRKDSPGLVEVWPLIQEEEEDDLSAWSPPLAVERKEPAQKQLALLIAKTIQLWIKEGSAKAGDILILVRRRTAFVDALIRTLKDHHVPVAGIDRLWLLEGIAIQDLLKIAEFLLLPEDDLTLATVLKGPLFGHNEEDLFRLAYDRDKKSLWRRLQENPGFKDTTDLLKELLGRADYLTPFALFNTILGPLKGREKWVRRLGSDVLDSLDEFLNLCLRYQAENTPNLQGFLYWISQEVIELKRDLDQSDQVRVMTVHGSKGLQAPIVFLPDTTQIPTDLPSIGFYDNILSWLPPGTKDVPFTKMIKQSLREKQQEEYRRLLYVALTRAQDALYVCGFGEDKDDSWYRTVTTGMEKVGSQVEYDFIKGMGWRHGQILQRKSSTKEKKDIHNFNLPSWLLSAPAQETMPQVIRPSDYTVSSLRGVEDDESISELSSRDCRVETSSLLAMRPDGMTDSTLRGTLIHKLLELLPTLPEAERKAAGIRFLNKIEGAQKMTEIALNVINSFPDLFGANSQAEVPIIGMMGEKQLSGQMDRIVMGEDHILIIDYKTHENPPSLIPEDYLYQMTLYKDVVSKIFPGKTIGCGILWTQIPRLDLLSEKEENIQYVHSPKENVWKYK